MVIFHSFLLMFTRGYIPTGGDFKMGMDWFCWKRDAPGKFHPTERACRHNEGLRSWSIRSHGGTRGGTAQDHPPVMEDLWRIYCMVDLRRIYGGFTEDLQRIYHYQGSSRWPSPENLTDITDHVVLTRGQGTGVLCHYAALWRGKKQRRSIKAQPALSRHYATIPYTLWLFNIAMENGPFINVFLMIYLLNMVILHSYVK